MKNKKYSCLSGFLVLAALLLSSLACRLAPKAPQMPGDPIPVSTEAVASLEEKVQAVGQAASGETVELSFTEEEVTSFIALKLSSQFEEMITDPQAFLRDGKIQIYGDVKSGELVLPVVIMLEPKIDASGQARMELVSVDMGSIGVPDSLLTRIQDETSPLATELLTYSGENFNIESITVSDGVLKISGRRP
jgi:uncharacterized protein YpmS